MHQLVLGSVKTLSASAAGARVVTSGGRGTKGPGLCSKKSVSCKIAGRDGATF